MPVNILNLPGLRVLDFKETDTDYHAKEEPAAIFRLRAVYRNGRGYTFERLRAKVLYTDMFQERVRVQEKVNVKRKQRFEEISVPRVVYFEMATAKQEPDYEVKIQTHYTRVLPARNPRSDCVFMTGRSRTFINRRPDRSLRGPTADPTR